MTVRQLSLFKGKRQRGVRPPLPLEFQTHCAVADTLRVAASPGWLWTHFPAGELRDKATAARLYRMGTKRGFFDFLLISPTGIHHWLELKRGRAGLTDEQQAFMGELLRRGVPFGVARSYEAAIDILRDWDAVSTRLTVAA